MDFPPYNPKDFESDSDKGESSKKKLMFFTKFLMFMMVLVYYL